MRPVRASEVTKRDGTALHCGSFLIPKEGDILQRSLPSGRTQRYQRNEIDTMSLFIIKIGRAVHGTHQGSAGLQKEGKTTWSVCRAPSHASAVLRGSPPNQSRDGQRTKKDFIAVETAVFDAPPSQQPTTRHRPSSRKPPKRIFSVCIRDPEGPLQIKLSERSCTTLRKRCRIEDFSGPQGTPPAIPYRSQLNICTVASRCW